MVYKKSLIFLIYVYDGKNFTIIVKLNQIKVDMPDVTKFGRWKISCRQEKN